MNYIPKSAGYKIVVLASAVAAALAGLTGCDEGLEGKLNSPSPARIERTKGIYVPPSSSSGRVGTYYDCTNGKETIWVKDGGQYRSIPTDRNCR